MNVLYITYDGLTDSLGQSQVLPYLLGLDRSGYKIIILSCEKKYNFNRKKNEILNHLNKTQIIWVPIYYSSKPPVISTIYDIIKIFVKAKQIYRKYDFTIIHCRSYITSIIGLYFKRRYKIRFIFDMRGFYADERVEGGLWNRQNLIYNYIYKFFKKKEKQFFSEADCIVSLTENGKITIQNMKDISRLPLNIKVIPCCADLNLFSDVNIDFDKLSALRKQLGISPNAFVISYLGSIGTWYMLDEMLDFFKRLLLKNPNAIFLFISNEKNEVISNFTNLKLIPSESVVIVNSSRNDVPYYASLSHVSLFFIKPVFSKKASSPTKQGEIMGLGIPLICNAGVGDTDTIVSDSSTGYVVKKFTVAEYDAAIDSIDTLMKIPRKHIRDAAEKYFSLEMGVMRYNEIYKSLMP